MLFLIGTFGLNFPIFISTMAVRVFHTDASGYGLLSSIMAVGTISGALLGAGRDKPRFEALLIGAAIFGLGCTLAAIAPNYWLLTGALFVIGVAALTFTNATSSLMQLSTQPAMRGRSNLLERTLAGTALAKSFHVRDQRPGTADCAHRAARCADPVGSDPPQPAGT